ncbi:MAG: type VI secretion system lipoprotein TssJ [Shewanella sp.]
MNHLRLALIFILSCQLFACSSSSEPKDLPSILTYSIHALDDVNPNLEGKATPLAFQVFELEDDSKLLDVDYDSLIEDYEDALGTNYVDHSDYTLLPGQFKFIEPKAIDEDTRYIGVVAQYGNPDISQWKKVIKIKSTGREFHILILLKEQEVILNKVE